MKDLTIGKLVISSVANHDMKLTVQRPVVLVQGLDDEAVPSQGNKISVTQSWFGAWALCRGAWLMVASDETVVKKPTD